jgi:hypothetical protein
MANIMVISKNDQDLALGASIAQERGYRLHKMKSVLDIQTVLSGIPDWFVIYDGEDPKLTRSLLELLPRYVKPSKVFATTKLGLEKYEHLLKYPVFSHHMRRNFDPPAPAFYSRLFASCLYLKPRGLEPFFDTGAVRIRSFELKRSTHKNAAIAAIQNTLTGLGVPSRLSKSVAQAIDELVLNALFDAPVDEYGKRYRHAETRDSDFTLSEREQIQIEFAMGPNYAGICVADRFGSIERSRVFGSVRNYLRMSDEPEAKYVAGFGLQGIMRSGLSLMLLSQPTHRTEAMVFFPIVRDFKEFRNGFKFFSILAAD